MTDEIRVETPGGVAKRYRLENAAVIRKLEDQSIAKLRTPQPLQTKTGKVPELDPSDDLVFLERAGSDEFGGILGDITRRGTTIELLVDSFQQAARDAPPSGATESISGADRSLIQNAVDDVPELDRGTIELTAGDLQFDIHHASPALRMKLVREATGAEMRFNADQTVDYQPSVGGDKTNTTLSPSNQQFVDSIRVDEETGPVTANHLRVIGADGSSADASVTVIDIAREKWRRAYFRDTSDEATLQRRGETLLEELRNPWLQARATLSDPPNGSLDPRPGDEYHVEIPKKDVDEDLTVREATARINASDGDTYEVVLSNRTQTPETAIEKLDQTARDTGGGGSTVPEGSPTLRAEYLPPGSKGPSFIAGVYLDGETAYSTFINSSNDVELAAVDLTNPDNPVLRDSVVVSRPLRGLYPHGSGGLVGGGSSAVGVYDISDPDNLAVTDEVSNDGYGVVTAGDYGYVAGDNYLDIYDLADPSNISRTAQTQAVTSFNPRQVTLNSGATKLYVSGADQHEFSVLDIGADAEQPPFSGVVFEPPNMQYLNWKQSRTGNLAVHADGADNKLRVITF
jgi:hypothetical protein